MDRTCELKARGWEKRATYDEPRLTEMVEFYEELGFEVLLEPLLEDGNAECAACMKEHPALFKTIYTREVRED